MPICTFFACSESAFIDKFTNNLSAVNIMQNWAPSAFPLWVPEIVLSMILVRGDEEPSEIQMNLMADLDGKELKSFPLLANFGEMLRHSAVIRLHGMLVPDAGRLSFTLKFDSNSLATFIIDVSLPPVETKVIAGK